jgi:hypothetical protein
MFWQIVTEELLLIFSFKKNVTLIYLGKSVKNKLAFTMTAYTGQTWTMLGQLCAALWDSQPQPIVIEPGCL